MGKPLCRQNGLYQWNATVSGIRNKMRQAMLVTVFCDTRRDAIDAVCAQVVLRGYDDPTVNHITKIRR